MICLFDINKRNLASPAKRIRTLPNIRQGMDGFCAALWAAGKDRHDGHELTIMDACAAHVAGAKKSANAKKMFLHGFFQFPTDIKVTDNNQRLFLAIAVDFVDQTYGGNAVFHARIDRDEKGKHGVDVFFAPRYEKHTKSKGVEQWVSLSKFSKENARRRFGKRKKKVKDKKTDNFKPVMGSAER